MYIQLGLTLKVLGFKQKENVGVFTGIKKSAARAGRAVSRLMTEGANAAPERDLSRGLSKAKEYTALGIVCAAVATALPEAAQAAGLFGSAGSDTRLFDNINTLGESTHTELAKLVRYGALIGLTLGGLVFAFIPPMRRHATGFLTGAVIGVLVVVFAEPLVNFLGIKS